MLSRERKEVPFASPAVAATAGWQQWYPTRAREVGNGQIAAGPSGERKAPLSSFPPGEQSLKEHL